MVLLCVLAIHPKITFSHLTLVILRSRSQGCTCYRDTIFGVELLTAFLVTKIGRALLRKPPFLPPHTHRARTHRRTHRTHTAYASCARTLHTAHANCARTFERGKSFLCHVFLVKSVQNLRTFWRTTQNLLILALLCGLEDWATTSCGYRRSILSYYYNTINKRLVKCIWELRNISKDKKIIIMKIGMLQKCCRIRH